MKLPAVGAAVVNCTGSGSAPQANLVAAPQPLAFGSIVNNTTRDLAVTFSADRDQVAGDVRAFLQDLADKGMLTV